MRCLEPAASVISTAEPVLDGVCAEATIFDLADRERRVEAGTGSPDRTATVVLAPEPVLRTCPAGSVVGMKGGRRVPQGHFRTKRFFCATIRTAAFSQASVSAGILHRRRHRLLTQTWIPAGQTLSGDASSGSCADGLRAYLVCSQSPGARSSLGPAASSGWSHTTSSACGIRAALRRVRPIQADSRAH